MEGKLNFYLIGIIAFLSAAVAFIVIYLVMTGGVFKPAAATKDKNAEKKIEIDYKKAKDYLISDMIFNLKPEESNPKAAIKLDVSITLADAKFEEEFIKRAAEIQDIIRSTFNSKTASEIEGEKINKVKDELLEKFKAMYHEEPKESAKILKVWIPKSYIQK